MHQANATDTGSYTFIIEQTRVEDRDGKYVGSISRFKGRGTYQWKVGNMAIIPAGRIDAEGVCPTYEEAMAALTEALKTKLSSV